jgi:hypothetical protein
VGTGSSARTATSSPPSTNATSATLTVVVRIRATVKGYTRLTFRSDQFRSALAKTLGIDVARITISSVDDARRRAADSGVAVTSDVGYPTGTNTAEVLSNVAGSADRLTANIRAEGMTDATVTALDPVVVSLNAAPASQPVMTDAAAAAVGVLGSLLLVIAIFLCFRKPISRSNPKMISPEPPSSADSPAPELTGVKIDENVSFLNVTNNVNFAEAANPGRSSPLTFVFPGRRSPMVQFPALAGGWGQLFYMPVRREEVHGHGLAVVDGAGHHDGVTADLVVLGNG